MAFLGARAIAPTRLPKPARHTASGWPTTRSAPELRTGKNGSNPRVFALKVLDFRVFRVQGFQLKDA